MNKRIVIWSALAVVGAAVLGYVYWPGCTPIQTPIQPEQRANQDVFLLVSDNKKLRQEVLANVTKEYRRSSESMPGLLERAIEEHRDDRRLDSPLHLAILTASNLRAFEAEDVLLTIVEYELDISKMPVGIRINGLSLFPAAKALVDLRVSPAKVLSRIEMSRSEKETRLLSWVLCQRLGSLDKARELVKQTRAERSQQNQEGYLKAEELLAGVMDGHELVFPR